MSLRARQYEAPQRWEIACREEHPRNDPQVSKLRTLDIAVQKAAIFL